VIIFNFYQIWELVNMLLWQALILIIECLIALYMLVLLIILLFDLLRAVGWSPATPGYLLTQSMLVPVWSLPGASLVVLQKVFFLIINQLRAVSILVEASIV
jgi:hypothetical protein